MIKRAASLVFLVLSGCSIYHPKPLTHEAVESSLQTPSGTILKVEVEKLKNPLLRPVSIDLSKDLNPEEAAIVAVLLNPSLRAERDRRGLAVAQVVQAGVLPNPQIIVGRDFVVGGNTAGSVNPFGWGASWDVTSLITLKSKLKAARENSKAVDLDVAWMEWQTAQAARSAAYRVISLESQLAATQQACAALEENVKALKTATDHHEKTVLDLAAAQSTSEEATLTFLSIKQELEKQRLVLKQALGLPPDFPLHLASLQLPASFNPPQQGELMHGIEKRRLDLLALQEGYASEDANLRTAILAQFPKINIGLTRAGDASDVQTFGFGVTMDIPTLDRNQGNIGTERATRQKLFDEYTARVFEARSDVAIAMSDISLLNRQIDAGMKSVTALEDLVKTAKAALESGNTDVLSYYQSRYNLILKQVEVLKFQQQLIDTQIALEIASGRYLPNTNTP